mmetsp:Transcript_24341/g.72536  ORF Transcript_24341/g.72536 Transcript_24341/m.72536 type:complete len:477 (-) Transcript_24341:102-1532(-)
MSAAPSGVGESRGLCSRWNCTLVGRVGGTGLLLVLTMICSLLYRRCCRKELALASPEHDEDAPEGEEGGNFSLRHAVTPESRERLGPTPEPSLEGPEKAPGPLTPTPPRVAADGGRWSPQHCTPVRGRQLVPAPPVMASPIYCQSPHVQAGGADGSHAQFGGGASPSSPSKTPERRTFGNRQAAGSPSLVSRPIEEILAAAAKSHDLHWSIRVGSCEKSLVEILIDAFQMLGISNGEELLEQFRSDAGRRENVWIGTRDTLMENVRTYIQDAGLRPDDARPILCAASGLLSRSLRRFAAQAAGGGGSPGPSDGLRASLRFLGVGDSSSLFGTAGLCGPLPNPTAHEGPSGHLERHSEERLLEQAFQIVSRTTTELSRITAAASQASRAEAQELLAQRRVLEESQEYLGALDYLEERMGTPSGAWDWASPFCGGIPLCDGKTVRGGLKERESAVSPTRFVEAPLKRSFKDDQVLLRL